MSVATSTASGAAQGAAAGSAAGPYGAIAGAVIGGAMGFMSGSASNEAKKKRRRAKRAKRRAAAARAALTGIEAQRARAEIVRQAKRAEANVNAQAVTTGTNTRGTSINQSDIATQLASELGFDEVANQLSNRSGQFLQRASKYIDSANRDAERAAEIDAFSSSITGAIGTFGGNRPEGTANVGGKEYGADQNYGWTSNNSSTRSTFG